MPACRRSPHYGQARRARAGIVPGASLLKSTACIAATLFASASLAHAQTAPSPAPSTAPTPATPAAKSGQTTTKRDVKPAADSSNIVVTGVAQDYKSSIDRRSYSIDKDLQKGSSSLGDALRNIPSVDVDVQGNLSLRGDTSVTVLVDGKPSAMFNGSNRADALQQLPADQYERVEVITNPSAAYKPDGTGGIINLISKKAKPTASQTGSVKLNVGNDNRYNAGVSGAYSMKGLSLSGNANYSHNTSRTDGTGSYAFTDPITGALVPARSSSQNHVVNNNYYAGGSVNYDLSAKDRLTGYAGVFQGDAEYNGSSVYRSDALTGPLVRDYNLTNNGQFHYSGKYGSASFLRKYSGQDHQLSVEFNYNDFRNRRDNAGLYVYQAPVQPNLFQDIAANTFSQVFSFKTEYKGPLPNKAKLITGYEVELDLGRSVNNGSFGTSAANAAPAAALTNTFKSQQTVNSVYATYEQSFGKFTVLPGLRVEQVSIDTQEVTTASHGAQDYSRAYPTLHLAYEIDDHSQLKASYSERVQRPSPDSLNPYRIYSSPTSYSQGNPNLHPQITHSYELGYEFRQKAAYYVSTFYFRDNTQVFTPVTTDLGGGVLLTSQANLGHSRNAGLELVANNPLTKTLSVNASTNLFWNEIDASNLGFNQRRSATVLSGRVNVNWQATKTDFLQLNTNVSGKQLTAQGYREGMVFLNLGWRHKFDDRLSAVVTVNDPFDMIKYRTVIDTPSLKQTNETRPHQRGFYIGLTYALGAPSRRPETFDFNNGAAPGGAGAGPVGQ